MSTRAGPWIALYLILITLPLGLLLLGETPRGGGFWWDFALALGYFGLAMMGIQFALTARFKRMAAPFGIDIIYYFHRYLAAAAFVLLLAHAALLAGLYPDSIGALDPRRAPAYMTLAWVAMAAFTLVMLTSLWRRALGIEYDRWRRWHVGLALIGILAATAHVLGSGSYLQSPLKRGLWIGLALSWVGLVLWVRVLRPWRLLRQPWRVVAKHPELGRSWTLTLEPVSGTPFAYQAGQFAWLTLRASPFAMREHPFSFSSTPTRPGTIAFTIKELGDFTSTIGSIEIGETAYVDGPYGAFHLDRFATAPGFVFIAGGVGIAPIMSMLRALADAQDPRPLRLFYGNRRFERIVFREELEALSRKLDLRVIHVLGEPPDGWAGESGLITEAILARHLPAERNHLHYLVCGPEPMIRLTERNLRQLGIPLGQLHSEIFDLA